MDIPRTPPRRTGRYVAYAVAVVALVVGVTVGLRRLRPAAPSVEKGTVWMDKVQRGPMVREVLGQGTLVPEEIQWIAAKTSARVEKVPVKPGAVVKADTVILELSNSDLELQALEADRQLAQAQAELVNLGATLNGQKLAQESTVASIGSDLADAKRRARADEELAKKGFLSELEQGQTLGRANELAGRLEFEKKRLLAQSQGIAAQVAAQKAQVERLRSIAQFRRKEVDGLKLRAGVDGVLQELSLQNGQAVQAGALLAKVVRPDRLKAEIRIPETQTKDVAIGQKATVDTRNGVVAGHVVRIDPAAQGGTVRVDVTLDGALPAGARPDLNVEGTIELERLASVLYVGRPASGQPGATVGLFRLDADGAGAERVAVKLGRSSVKNIEILGGLREGDRVILSDMSQWDQVDRIRLP
ncbi:MAG TPA: HlyD family efflux transporter periplasmic adaptor subunit [Polyangia bacterium]|nr:HlyD family efflux transporter periplasmic adaptor subunit [Polyangia bacterium]